MGTFRQRIELAARPDGRFVSADALVDTGATYTRAPRSVVATIGVTTRERDSNRRLVKAEQYLT